MICPRCHRGYAEMGFCPHDGTRLVSSPRISLLDWKDTPLEGMTLKDRYQILGLIGQGGIATIYLAEDLTTGEPVAVKMLRAGGNQSRQRERLFHEVMATSAIGHPNIVKIFDCGEREDRTPYVIMEYLWGESMGDHLRRVGKMPPEQALPLMLQVAKALDAGHQIGVVHRDVKPDNIYLIGALGEPYEAKVVDFGLAKSRLQLTAMGTAVGTAEYMAPEQALTDPVDGRADVYGLGSVLYRAFTGKLPVEGNEPTEMLARQVLCHPPYPFPDVTVEQPSAEGDAPRDTGAIALARIGLVVKRAMKKRPDLRYPNMGAMIADLEILIGQRHGYLAARNTPPGDDIYIPQQAFGLIVIRQFYSMLKMTVPATMPPTPGG